jgi:hypothetical protein
MAVAVRAARLPQLPCRSLPEHSYAKLKQRDDKSLVLTFLDWASVPLSGLDVPVLCWFLDAGNDETLGRLSWPASKKRQCTKSRECGTRQCSECYGDRMLVAISMVDAARASCVGTFETWRDVRVESEGKAEVGLRGRQGSL